MKYNSSFFNSIVPNATEFMAQNIPFAKQFCSFGMNDLERLRNSNIFPSGTEIRGYDFTVRPDLISPVWVAFPEYPCLLGLKYPFHWSCGGVCLQTRYSIHSNNACGLENTSLDQSSE